MKRQNHWHAVCGLVVLFISLVGCRPFDTPEPLPTSAIPTPTSPISDLATPTAQPSALSVPLPVLDEGGVLHILYGDRLQGDAETGWLATVEGGSVIPWVGPIAAGSFTEPGGVEVVVLVGGLSVAPADTASAGDALDVRWIVLRYGADGSWRIIGRSSSLGFNLDRSAALWRVSTLADFDRDGRQELLAVNESGRPDLRTETTHLFRWDGASLAQVWTATTYEDDMGAIGAPAYYIYEAAVGFDEAEGVPEIALDATIRYFGTDDQGNADPGTVIRSDTVHRRFRWDGTRFGEFSMTGPATPFAFTDADGVWLWEDGEARQLDGRRVDDLAWSSDGLWLAYEAWWPAGEQGVWLYDVQTGVATQVAATEATVYALEWSPVGDTLAYPLAHPTEIRLYDPIEGGQTTLPASAEGLSWSPDGQRLVYAERGSLVRYTPSTQRTEVLVRAGEEADTAMPGVNRPVWSPRGDLIACAIASDEREQFALVPADLPNPIEVEGLSDLAMDVSNRRVEASWSPLGDRVAVLTTDPRSHAQPSMLYLVEALQGWAGEPPLEPRQLARLDDPAQSISPPAWSPDGRRLAAVVGTEVWVWEVGTGVGQSWYVLPAFLAEASAHWAPDGGGFLVRHGGQLYWFTADMPGTPTLLLQRDGLDRVQFAPEVRPR